MAGHVQINIYLPGEVPLHDLCIPWFAGCYMEVTSVNKLRRGLALPSSGLSLSLLLREDVVFHLYNGLCCPSSLPLSGAAPF